MLYSQYVKEKIPNTLPENKTGGYWRSGGRRYRHICKDIKDNFLEKMPVMANFKGNIYDCPIKYHKDACSLNSSQVMCINFFWKFFQKEMYEKVLLSALGRCGISISSEVSIENAIVEYEPFPKEGTNYDFYLILTSGQHISMEIKYTESEFGGISEYKSGDPIKYGKKWDDVYSVIVAKCPYLKSRSVCKNGYICMRYGNMDAGACEESCACDIYRFFSHYQINRNIALAGNDDIVVFLTPRANTSLNVGREYIDGMNNPCIRNLYWEDMVNAVLAESDAYPELMRYYTAFQNKYITFVP